MFTIAPTMHPEGNLTNTRVLVTRPAHQAEDLVRLIQAEGGEAIRFPVVQILEPRDSVALLELIDRLDEFDMAIFVSRNAVSMGMNMIMARQRKLPEHLVIACIGDGSAREFKHYGIETPVVPKGRFDSEALLALPELADVRRKNIVIFRGAGGRELLANVLAERDAHVEYAECYRRARPDTDITPLLRRWARGTIDIVTLTSVEGLRNLFDMAGKSGQQCLIRTPVVVISERMAEVCRELGFKAGVYVADDASDGGIVNAVRVWRTWQNSL